MSDSIGTDRLYCMEGGVLIFPCSGRWILLFLLSRSQKNPLDLFVLSLLFEFG